MIPATMLLAGSLLVSFGDAYATNEPIVLMISIDRCVPCLIQQRNMEDLERSGEWSEIAASKINLDRQPEYRSQFLAVNEFPTTYFISADRKQAWRTKGRLSKEDLRKIVTQLFRSGRQ